MAKENFTLSGKTESIVCKELGIETIEEALNIDYNDITPQDDVDRAKVQIYELQNRGTVRLNAGRYYTAKEWENRVEKTKALKLP